MEIKFVCLCFPVNPIISFHPLPSLTLCLHILFSLYFFFVINWKNESLNLKTSNSENLGLSQVLKTLSLFLYCNWKKVWMHLLMKGIILTSLFTCLPDMISVRSLLQESCCSLYAAPWGPVTCYIQIICNMSCLESMLELFDADCWKNC